MTNQEIRELVNINNRAIKQLSNPAQFVLNPEIQSRLKDNELLRELCTHSFENGFCIYCDKEG